MAERHDPLADADPNDADLESDGVQIDADTDSDSAGVDLSAQIENEDGSMRPRTPERSTRAAAASTRESREAVERPEDAGQEHGDEDRDDEDDDDRVARGAQPRNDRGEFTRAGERGDRSYQRGKGRAGRLRREIGDLTREVSRLREEHTRLASSRPAGERTEAAPPAKSDKQKQLEALGPRPKWRDFESQGKSSDDYDDAVAGWIKKSTRLELEIEQEQAAAATRRTEDERRQADEQRQAGERWKGELDAVHAKHPDFDELLDAAEEDDVEIHTFIAKTCEAVKGGGEMFYQLLRPENGPALDALNDLFESIDLKSTFPLRLAFERSADPARFLMALTDPKVQKELKEALRLSPAAATVACGQLEGRLASSASVARTGRPRRRTASPPPSYRAGTRTAHASRASDPNNESVDDHFKRRMREERDKRRSA